MTSTRLNIVKTWVASGPAGALGSIHRTEDGYTFKLLSDDGYQRQLPVPRSGQGCALREPACRVRSGRSSGSTSPIAALTSSPQPRVSAGRCPQSGARSAWRALGSSRNTVGMTDTITLIGFVATVPKHLITGEGLPITSFRLASTQRRFDRAQGRWADGETNWYTVTTFRQLAINTVDSVNEGRPRHRLRPLAHPRLGGGDRSGTNVDVEADAVGHDLGWGTTAFTRTIVTAPSVAACGGATWQPGAGAMAARTPTRPRPARRAVRRRGRLRLGCSLAEAADADSVAVPF